MRVPNLKSRIRRLEEAENIDGVQESDISRLLDDLVSAVNVEMDGSKDPQDLKQAADLESALQNMQHKGQGAR